MKTSEIVSNLEQAMTQVLDNDINLIERGLNELNFNNLLTKYLRTLFDGFDVDNEYNGDQLKDSDRKALDIAKNRMVEIGISPAETNNYRLTPDIIVHTRNTNNNNLLVLEVKKDTNSKRNKEFDLLKLEHLTIDYLGNHYNYKLGISLIYGTKENAGKYELRFFQNGIETTIENLK